MCVVGFLPLPPPKTVFTRPLSMMRTTTTAATAMKRCSPRRRAAIPSLWLPLSKARLALRLESVVTRLPVLLREIAVQSLDPTTELFATLSSVAVVDAENDDDVRPAVAFTCSSSSPSTSGRGLVATRPLERGEVALRVPGSICLVVDYSNRGSGLSLPQKQSSSTPSSPSSSSSWPRTSAAVAKDPSTPWDFLLALALLDCANHSMDPAAAYRPVWRDDLADGKRKLEAVELVALRAIPKGQEVTISYFAGAAGATNRRLFSLYGFVPSGGNPGDRVEGLDGVVEEEEGVGR